VQVKHIGCTLEVWHVHSYIGVNPAGDAGDVSPPIFWLVGTSMGMSPPIFGVAM